MSASREDIERLYRAVADGEPQREIMQMIYDIFGHRCELRPPRSRVELGSPMRSQECGAWLISFSASIGRSFYRLSMLPARHLIEVQRSRSWVMSFSVRRVMC
ncbi:hypothetical protein D3C71_1275780 [compost metagenome]